MIRRTTQRVCARLGLKGHSSTKQTRHLAYDHASMQAVRTYVSMLIKQENIDWRLMCHFDQVWTTQYEAAKRVLFKPVEQSGQIRSAKQKPSTEQMLASIKRALNMPCSEDSDSKKKQGYTNPTLCAQSTLVPIEYQRHARTTTTLSFADGTLGRAYVTASQTVL